MRSFLSAVLVVLAAALVPVSLLSVWVHDHVDSTSAYVDDVAPLADDPDVQDAVVDAVAGTTYDALQEKVPVGLPGGVEDLVGNLTRRVVDSDRFPELWREANRLTHREFLDVVHGDDSVADGAIEVRLGPVVDLVLDELAEEGLPVDLLPELDPTIDLAADRTLGERRELYQQLDAIGWWAPAGAGLLALGAVALAHGWRGRARTLAAVGLLGGAASALVVVGLPLVLDRVEQAARYAQRDLVRAIADALTASLDDAARLVAVGGGVLFVVALVASFVPVGSRRRSTPAAGPAAGAYPPGPAA